MKLMHGEDEENETPSSSLKTDARKGCWQRGERELVVCFSGGGKVLWQPWVVLLVAGGFIQRRAQVKRLSFGWRE
jgi:uncharacterized protein (AIM24 family)